MEEKVGMKGTRNGKFINSVPFVQNCNSFIIIIFMMSYRTLYVYLLNTKFSHI